MSLLIHIKSMSKKKNRLAIFDIDGTLTNTVEIHQSAFVNALHKFGLFDFDTNYSFDEIWAIGEPCIQDLGTKQLRK
jgi:beta-phosphoglucomutase-like phosphatase (HAD superfamily)